MIFSEPPEVTRKRPPTLKWTAIAESLKENPGKYGLVGNFSLGVGSHIRKGKYASLVPLEIRDADERADYMERHWNVTTRRSGIDRADIYIVWIGEDCGCESCQ
jgi:hypothetical protein